MKKIAIAIHGGAGTLLKGIMTPDKEISYKKSLETALNAGYKILENKGNAVDAVTEAVRILEDSPLFNAGKGSVFTNAGSHEMDASIMNGENLEAGAVSLISGIKNPILLAKNIMQKSEHVFLAGTGAMEYANLLGYKLEPEDYFYDDFRYNQWQEIKDSDNFQLDHNVQKDSKFGTVGAVACDFEGNVAAATSTGGMTNKKFGRIGDSPMIGAGTYANNNTCAVSCTGTGEFFIRGVVAYDVSCLMEYKGLSLKDAADEVVQKRLISIGGDGGLIAVDAKGNITTPFNTEGMYRASIDTHGTQKLDIYK
ncbi:isoaspartyl peptidase [Salegentibacter salinarum]|uniref:Isoaspartyl peptidase n=1 Tax=Salegentibacter salinarum TaxID=447422 RepID=A0A2N0U0W8_9FLAO|nr:isoaspartyl peptidase/L-asparaginase [Salegentibacter salinarum]PKD20644.1 isoaspartyl peptidase [Salegentibacter salinarum]SKB83083.1 beta-aspartyl-peptidase (threonine type) [Salegentibacter salinarum]